MSESMKSKVVRLLVNVDVEAVSMNYKCKTKDGMIYTIQSDKFCKDSKSDSDFAGNICNAVTEELIKITEDIEKDGYLFTEEDMVSIKKSEIIRIWVELGDLYYAEGVFPE